MRRLLLAVTRDGDKWVEPHEGEYVPKIIQHNGTEYRVIMAMRSTLVDIANQWWRAPVRHAAAATLSVVPNVPRP
jgi:hypothetical protein